MSLSLCILFLISFLRVSGGNSNLYDFTSGFQNAAVTGNYSCDELTRWLGSEKHYSNDKKDVLFGLLANKDCREKPVIMLQNVGFGWSMKGANKRSFFQSNRGSEHCKENDKYAVAYLSNFSINNNFSHFLHGLLRLFCALLDARWIVWDGNNFVQKVNYTIWLDEFFKQSEAKMVWIKSLGGNTRSMAASYLPKGQCAMATNLLYGSGCVRLLPPEKWFGYPGCRAREVLPAFGHYMRQKFMAAKAQDLILIDKDSSNMNIDPGLRVAFSVRDVGIKTGARTISNLGYVQALLRKTQHVRTSTENITFEHLDVPSTVRYMAGAHIFVSVHGAGMTNMLFMNPGSAVVEIIPYPLCNCRSPDYFYGVGGYYHGSAVAQGIKHYPYCVPEEDVVWHVKPEGFKVGLKCSWKHLHVVASVSLDATRFVSLMRNVERDLVVSGTIVLTRPIINVTPHANG